MFRACAGSNYLQVYGFVEEVLRCTCSDVGEAFALNGKGQIPAVVK
jgi:hypothetical protein